MSEEIKNKAAELTDEEIEKVAGGILGNGKRARCKVVSNQYGSSFCSNKCKYNGTTSCVLGLHFLQISDVELQNEYDEWVKSNNLQ